MKLRLTVDVEYINATRPDLPWLKRNLREAIERAVGDGLLTADHDVEVESWTATVEAVE